MYNIYFSRLYHLFLQPLSAFVVRAFCSSRIQHCLLSGRIWQRTSNPSSVDSRGCISVVLKLFLNLRCGFLAGHSRVASWKPFQIKSRSSVWRILWSITTPGITWCPCGTTWFSCGTIRASQWSVGRYVTLFPSSNFFWEFFVQYFWIYFCSWFYKWLELLVEQNELCFQRIFFVFEGFLFGKKNKSEWKLSTDKKLN